jgi:hypothetical protein
LRITALHGLVHTHALAALPLTHSAVAAVLAEQSEPSCTSSRELHPCAGLSHLKATGLVSFSFYAHLARACCLLPPNSLICISLRSPPSPISPSHQHADHCLRLHSPACRLDIVDMPRNYSHTSPNFNLLFMTGKSQRQTPGTIDNYQDWATPAGESEYPRYLVGGWACCLCWVGA